VKRTQKTEIEAPAEPLAAALRPRALDEVIGQGHVLGPGGALRQMVEARHLTSLIFWGPPGCGKTTIAWLLADACGYRFEAISAVFSGVADLRKVFERARENKNLGERTLLFVDEIHRFNRAQQDAFLPYVEDGTVTLVGATTENPSFELNGALLSRCQVIVLQRLDDDALLQLLARAEKLTGKVLPVTDDARLWLAQQADGDGRYLLNMAESLLSWDPGSSGLRPSARDDRLLDVEALQKLLQKRAPLYDKAQEGHYNLISALHKAVRGSDVNAALYWMARMLAGGEDPEFIARRIVRMAYEDIGMADPNAALQAMAAWQTYERLGSPEGELALAQAVIYLATAPKSVAGYKAFGAAKRAAADTGSLTPPPYAMNAPTKLMKNLGYSDGYIYDPDTPEGFSGLNYFPPGMKRAEFYAPVERGFEREIKKRLEYWEKLRRQS